MLHPLLCSSKAGGFRWGEKRRSSTSLGTTGRRLCLRACWLEDPLAISHPLCSCLSWGEEEANKQGSTTSGRGASDVFVCPPTAHFQAQQATNFPSWLLSKFVVVGRVEGLLYLVTIGAGFSLGDSLCFGSRKTLARQTTDCDSNASARSTDSTSSSVARDKVQSSNQLRSELENIGQLCIFVIFCAGATNL